MRPTGVIDALAARRASLVALARRLPDARWYGDKGRSIAAIDIEDVAAVAADPAIGLAVIRVGFEAGDDSRYLLPLAVETVRESRHGVLLPAADGAPAIVDALTLPRFPAWLFDRMTDEADLAGERGRFVWERLPGGALNLARARLEPGRVIAAEQSNSAVRYGDTLIVKLFRRLHEGVNPDFEVSRFLWEQTDFRNIPVPVVAGTYQPDASGSFAIAFGQAFVPNAGDGWAWTLRQIEALLALEGKAERRAAIDRYAEAAATLGRRTAEMHRALASRPDVLAFAPTPLPAERLRLWERSLQRRLGAALTELEADPALPPSIAALLPALIADRPALDARATGFAAEAGDFAIRVHGDFHLGQVLRSSDDWTILDFEGEPARPLTERREKTSALKDVAGMLRSFAYAHGAALQREPDAGPTLAAWEAASRDAFLAAYRVGIGRVQPPIAPPDAAAFRQACDAWELDKAVYEIDYERRNRPEWLAIPLAALLRRATE